MDDENNNHKLRLLAIYKDNLREIETQVALFGMAPPIHLINELKHHQRKIEEIHLTLNSNAQEISFNELIVNIEDLRAFASEEVKKAVRDYRQMRKDHSFMDKNLAVLMYFAIVGAVGFHWLCTTFLANLPAINIVSVAGPAILVISAAIYVHYRMFQYSHEWSKRFAERFDLK